MGSLALGANAARGAAIAERALDVDPRFGDGFYNMGCAYSLRGDKDLALRYLRLAALNHYAEKDQLLSDPDLSSLQGEPGLSAIVLLMEAEQGTRP